MLSLSAGQRGVARGFGSVRARTSDPQANLLFPGDGGVPSGGGEPDSSAAWRKGKLTLGGDYWWRETGDSEPEISLTDPTDDWRVGTLDADGREYFWRESADGEEVEVRLARYDGDEPGDDEEEGGGWRLGVLPSGREYLWRETDDPDDPDVQWWTEGTLDSGEPFWYDEEGEVTLTDPFARARRTSAV